MLRRLIFVSVLLGIAPFCVAQGVPDDLILRRGNANSNGTVDQSDATCITNWLFLGGAAPPCLNQADADNSGAVDVSDAVYLLSWLFQGGSEPPAPGPYNTLCTTDNDPHPGCATRPCV